MSVCVSAPETLAVIAHLPLVSSGADSVYAEQVHQRQRGSGSAIEWSEQILDYKVNIIIQVKLSYEST